MLLGKKKKKITYPWKLCSFLPLNGATRVRNTHLQDEQQSCIGGLCSWKIRQIFTSSTKHLILLLLLTLALRFWYPQVQTIRCLKSKPAITEGNLSAKRYQDEILHPVVISRVQGWSETSSRVWKWRGWRGLAAVLTLTPFNTCGMSLGVLLSKIWEKSQQKNGMPSLSSEWPWRQDTRLLVLCSSTHNWRFCC